MIDTSTILNSMKSIKLFVKYTFNELLDADILSQLGVASHYY